MIVHGIPGPYELRDGDVISIDVGVTLRGWVADSAITVAVGDVAGEAPRLLETCRQSLVRRDRRCAAPARTSRTSATRCRRGSRERASASSGRSSATASAGGCTRTRRCRTTAPPGRGPVLAAGMVLAIEPMITAGDHAIQPDADDGWSIYTADGSLSAHFEHTVAVTEDGPLVLTRHDGWSPVDEPVAAAA